MNTRRDEIYESITRKELLLLFFAGGIIGFIVFAMCYGTEVLNVTYDGWLLSGGDLSQHYIGWKFFRHSSWHFPIGMIDGLVYPQQTCIIFTDSVPLFALFFKLLSPILPDTFQYFGLWGAMTFFLMGAVSSVILRKATKNPVLCVVGSIFFSCSPYVFQRMFGHTALAGNWLILLAIAIWIYKPYFCTFKRKTLAWTALLVTASLVHIYYIPMIMIFMFFSCVQDLIEMRQWKMDIIMGILAIVVDLTVLGCVGAFSSTTAMEDGGLGSYSANLNVFWNPIDKARFLPTRPLINPGQDEGFGYLGFGILILLAAAIVLSFLYFIYKWYKGLGKRKKRIQDYSFVISMLLAITASIILAASPTISFNDRILKIINYPNFIMKILSIFRASGRFIWCASYIFMFFAVMTVISKIKNRFIAFGCLFFCMGLQIMDLDPLMKSRHSLTQIHSERQVLHEEQWENVLVGKKHIVFLSYHHVFLNQGSDPVYEFANMAIDHDLTINYCVIARVDLEQVAEDERRLIGNLQSGNYDNDTVYILDSVETGEQYHMNIQTIDGYVVGTY